MSTARLTLSVAISAALAGALWLGWSLAAGPGASATSMNVPSRALPPGVDGFEAQVEIARATVRLRLAPLHADPVLQSFDALALRRRLALPEGEPFALEIELAPSEQAPSRTGAGSRASAAPAPSFVLDAALLRVRDEQGPALATIPELAEDSAAARAEAAHAPADPLRTLVTARRVLVEAHTPTRVVLWGRTPHGAPRLSGLPDVPGGEVELAPQQWRADALEDVLARSPVAPAAAPRAPAAVPAETGEPVGGGR